ncbi:MAG: hypothetical protein HY332_00440 [Chloroflexi bacterium]|nr:hypothetical protein [Chloroflexota bacterium]
MTTIQSTPNGSPPLGVAIWGAGWVAGAHARAYLAASGAIHAVDSIRHILGADVTEVDARGLEVGSYYHYPPTALALVRYGNGCSIDLTFHASHAMPP